MVEALVAREYGRALLVAHRHELEEEVRIAFADGEKANLVDDQDRVGEIELEPLREVALLGGSPQIRDEVVAGYEVGPQPAFGGLYAYGDGEVGLARPRRAEEDDVLGALDEAEVLEVEYLVAVELRLEGEVVVPEGLVEGEMRHLDHRQVDPLLPLGELLGEERVEAVDDAHLAGVYGVDDAVYAGPDLREPERLEGVQHLDVIRHRARLPSP